MISTEFLLTALVVVVVPGTGVIYTVSTGLLQGGRASVAAAVGCTLGIVPHLVASSLGLSAILHYSALVFQLIKYAGALYLLFLAWSMWREAGAVAMQTEAQQIHRGYWRTAARGVTLNILNPKLSLFFLAFLPLFVESDGSAPMIQMLVLSLVFMAMTLLIFILYGLCANGARRYLIGAPRAMRQLHRGFAALLAALGFKLALAEP
ncbi:MAG: LysE family translocator [Desulfosarcinaceae bacterium]|nr:LysE family translocator [Desulfosarcinaceae bacterium]